MYYDDIRLLVHFVAEVFLFILGVRWAGLAAMAAPSRLADAVGEGIAAAVVRACAGWAIGR